MEEVAYFCAEQRVLTWGQAEERKKETCNISELQKPLNALFSALLTGDTSGIARHLSTCYRDILKNHPSYDSLTLVCAQLKTYMNIVCSMHNFDEGECHFEPEGFTCLEEEQKYLTTVFQELCSKTGKQRQLSSAVIAALIEIENRYMENLTLESVAKYAGISASYFSRLFSEALGAGFVKYYNMIRMFKAKQFICAGAGSVQEVSDRIGFTDVKYFSRVFKKIYGRAPVQYMREKAGDRS